MKVDEKISSARVKRKMIIAEYEPLKLSGRFHRKKQKKG